MPEKIISSTHIQKLGHKLLEIRERALFNIISKLDNGFTFDNDLARSRELLDKLFKWFIYEPCSNEAVVFSLINRILKSESGETLINHSGVENIKKQLERIRNYLESKWFPYLDQTIRCLEQQRVNVEPIVPPLESDVPLSYRSGLSSTRRATSDTYTIGNTATTIEGLVQKGPSVDQDFGIETPLYENSETSKRELIEIKDTDCLPNYTLNWQPLVEQDRHVLLSVEGSLKNPSQPSSLLHSCEFFVTVLLHDFPAEIFLQRPAIVQQFYFFLESCNSSRLCIAVLECLNSLTKALQVRLNHYNEPAMQNFKLEILPGFCETPSSEINSETGIVSFDRAEDVILMKNSQLTLPKFCFVTLRVTLRYMRTKNESGGNFNQQVFNISLLLLEELVTLLNTCVKKPIWDAHQNPIALKVLRDFNETLLIYGETLDYFRLESISVDNDSNYRAIYLYLLHVCAKILHELIPIEKSKTIIPSALKSAISNSLLDVTLARLYPKLHDILLEYAQCFCASDQTDHLVKYKQVKKICDGMSATLTFSRRFDSLNAHACLDLAKSALPSLEFHMDLNFVKVYVDFCSEKLKNANEGLLDMSQDVTLRLLAHHCSEIRNEMYKCCNEIISENMGPKLNSSSDMMGSRARFLLTSKIFTEIAMFGVTSEDKMIKSYAEDILIYIFKAKMVVCEAVWDKVVQSLIPSLPIIACHVGKTSLGRCVLNYLDPDTAKSMLLPDIVTLKTNIQFLFAPEGYLREEAFSRISWMMASQENSREMLPKFNTLYDKTLADACHANKVTDVNKIRHTEHFYQPSSLHQVMEVIKSPNVEPVIRRSALNQISVMLDDPLLHQIFIDLEGVKLITEIMPSALMEKDYRNYPDSIIPIVSILKSLCLYHSTVREDLGNNIEILHYILRGLFLFFTEERMKQDAAILLITLVFKDFIIGSPSKANFSLPKLICNSLNLPISCSTMHFNVSSYTVDNLKVALMGDRWCLSSIQIQWNCELFGGFDEIIKWETVEYDDNVHVEGDLKLNKYDLQCLKWSSISYCVGKYLGQIQNGTTHSDIIFALEKLTIYVRLFKLDNNLDANNILSLAWEKSLSRFLKSLPSCEDDVVLLRHVVVFLTELLPVYKTTAGVCWVTDLLRDPTQNILDLLSNDAESDEEEMKILKREILNMITVCVCQEQHYLDYCVVARRKSLWTHVIKVVADNLNLNDAQHFYNLAYLDALLSCLVHLTGTLGWSDGKPGAAVKQPIPQLISGLCDLINAFHCGKGASAAVSVMGLSITRHVLLVLNHLLAEIQNSEVKGWEPCFLGDLEETHALKTFLALWTSRDVVVRAAAFHLFSGLSASSRIAVVIVNDLKIDNGNIWELGITVLIDNSEASIVRENAALMLANLTNSMSPYSSIKSSSVTSVINGKKDYVLEILSQLEENNFFSHLEIILNYLFTLNFSERENTERPRCYFSNSISSRTSSSGNSEINKISCSTPGLVKTVSFFLYNLMFFLPDEISNSLQENGLVKLFFRTLFNPVMSIDNTRDLSLYCDLLEMNSAVCRLLKKLTTTNAVCLGTVLNTNDCLNVMFSLFSPKIYHTNLPQLMYLRNKFWTELFSLSACLLESCNDNDGNVTRKSVEAVTTFSVTIHEVGVDMFLECLCEALSCLGSEELQNASLIFLTSFLKIEIYKTVNSPDKTFENSFQSILDSVMTSRTVIMTSDNKKRSKSPVYSEKLSKTTVLEEIYFGKVISRKSPRNDVEISFVENTGNGLIAGAEICKILLYLCDVCEVKSTSDDRGGGRKKRNVTAALTGLLCVSKEAKRFALRNGFVGIVVKQLRDHHVKLSLESVDCLRRVQDKKRLCPVLQEIDDLVGLMTNFMVDDVNVKVEGANCNLADVVHKLWIWFLIQGVHLVDVLKMLCVFTADCAVAVQSLVLTSPVAGSGPRKTPSNISLLHAIISLIAKEMDLISKTHDLTALELSFDILGNSCDLLECRVLISKSNLFNCITRLYPSATKRQKPWEKVEFIWLDFLGKYTQHPEGQAAIAKFNDVLELIMSLTSNTKSLNKQKALTVLRNLSFYQPNRLRLITSGDFLRILDSKLTSGTKDEIKTVVIIMWALAANCQKAKGVFKSARLDQKLQNAIKQHQLLGSGDGDVMESEDVQRALYVLNLLRENEKIR